MMKGFTAFARLFLFMATPALLLLSCSVSKLTGEKKYSPQSLQKDFSVFRGMLEESQPSIYWFTPKDSMDRAFDEARSRLTDSMTERQFRTVLMKAITSMRDGHTSVSFSKRYTRYLDTANLPVFPLLLKVWKDTIVATGDLNRNDSVLKRGSVITSINHYPSGFLLDTFLNYITGDANSMTGRYQSLSSYGTFGAMYKNLFGLPDSFDIHFLNDDGLEDSTVIPVFKPKKDDNQSDSLRSEKYTPKERRNLFAYSSRSLQVDTTLHSGYLILNTFVAGNGLKRFIKKTFRNLQKLDIKYLAIDVRSNGGGDAGISTLLTRYLTDHPFVLADSLYTQRRSSKYHRHIRLQPFYWLATTIVTKKHRDGKFHFGYFEHHRFTPKKKYHYAGNVYILTGGNSFSATTLFAQELKGQPNVKIIGEETGGGGYGNTAWIIPELVLPHTRLRIGVPKFRFVMKKELIAGGRGVLPDVHVAPTAQDIRDGKDVKVEAVKAIIMQANGF